MNVIKNKNHRSTLKQSRCSSHKLNIEVSRSEGLNIEQITCNLCSQNINILCFHFALNILNYANTHLVN